MDLTEFERKIFSQNGEDGITMKLIELIYGQDNKNKYYVEFGVENGSECNTRILRELYGWNGLQMDGGYENPSINLRREFITKENIVELFRKYGVPQNINLLCVDIDYNDFYCLHEIIKHFQCDIIICEYNATHFAHEDKVAIYGPDIKWDTTNYYGVSLLALDKLAKKYGYTLVYCNANGVNAFFIRDEILKYKNIQIKDAGNVDKIYKPAYYCGGPNGGHPQDPFYRKYITFEEAFKI